jgi:hypothetical protein
VWSFGVFLYEVVTLGAFPFQGLNNNQVFVSEYYLLANYHNFYIKLLTLGYGKEWRMHKNTNSM